MTGSLQPPGVSSLSSRTTSPTQHLRFIHHHHHHPHQHHDTQAQTSSLQLLHPLSPSKGSNVSNSNSTLNTQKELDTPLLPLTHTHIPPSTTLSSSLLLVTPPTSSSSSHSSSTTCCSPRLLHRLWCVAMLLCISASFLSTLYTVSALTTPWSCHADTSCVEGDCMSCFDEGIRFGLKALSMIASCLATILLWKLPRWCSNKKRLTTAVVDNDTCKESPMNSSTTNTTITITDADALDQI